MRAGGGEGGVGGSRADRHLADLAMEDGKLKMPKMLKHPEKHTMDRE